MAGLEERAGDAVTRKLRPGERWCTACGGTGRVEVTAPPHGPYGEEPDVRLMRCDDCDGTGITHCGACGGTLDLDAAGLCPLCVDERAHGRAPDATGDEVREADDACRRSGA